ncbi:putative transcription repressor NiaR, partial [Dysosmobacter welbionis]
REKRRCHQHHWCLRLRQEHPAAVHQPAGDPHQRRDPLPRPERHRSQGQCPPVPLPCGHGVPVLQPVQQHDRAGKLHGRADQGTEKGQGDRPEAGHGVSGKGGHGALHPSQAPADLRRPEAAGGHCPGPGHGAGGAAVRRTHLRPGPGDGGRSPLRHAGPGPGGHDHAGGDS